MSVNRNGTCALSHAVAAPSPLPSHIPRGPITSMVIAYNAAKKLDVDPWLGGAIMAALMTPQLTGVMSGMSGTSVSSALSGEIQCSATSVFGAETCTVSAFGIPIQLNDYSGNIFVPVRGMARTQAVRDRKSTRLNSSH